MRSIARTKSLTDLTARIKSLTKLNVHRCRYHIRESKTYALGYIEIHWGGSEHIVAGEMHSMEVQLWHWNVEYASFEQASVMHDGLATISILFG